MPDTLYSLIGLGLPEDLRVVLGERIAELERGEFEKILRHPLARRLLGHDDGEADGEEHPLDAHAKNWTDHISDNSSKLLARSDHKHSATYRAHILLLIAVAALQAFLQSNVTGPPLAFQPRNVLFTPDIGTDEKAMKATRMKMLDQLVVDGCAPFRLVPNMELLCLAKAILTTTPLEKYVAAAEWARLRTDFVHQRLLGEVSPTLQTSIYNHLTKMEKILVKFRHESVFSTLYSEFLLEKVTIHLHHGFDKLARDTLQEVAKLRNFEFALTGALGKRTKWQEHDTSQLVVIAQSKDNDNDGSANEPEVNFNSRGPEALNLNDDTLLEKISFTNKSSNTTDVLDQASLPASLRGINPGNQPLLQPLDSISLLLLASSITNTSPADGLTREETLPYATRVLDGGSSNWQVYTQALLVRSRIEGYRSRTTERGLFQLQALVDQVIAETTSADVGINVSSADGAVSTFLPRTQDAESAPAHERLRYVYQLCSPTRWELEAELASRWVSLGGMRSALEIYERLEMWPEVALCWAAADREDKAKKIIRRQLYHATDGDNDDSVDLDIEKWEGKPRDPPPSDAPRLYCILGDLDSDVTFWQKAWDVSKGRYARAMRALGRHYFGAGEYVKAADSYSKALKSAQLHQQSWFALGCCLLELEQFERAIEAFSRVIQLDDSDAEAWSNLAAALLKKDSNSQTVTICEDSHVDDNEEDTMPMTSQTSIQKNRKDALQALKRAATLQHSNPRIWDNVLTVAASVIPPSYADIVNAQRRLIDLRSATEGEKCIDVAILEHLVRHVMATSESDDAEDGQTRGLPRIVCELVDTKVVPLITTSGRLWRLVASLALRRRLPARALEAHEKAWRAVIAVLGWEVGTKEGWEEVVVATEELVDAYENMGGKMSEASGELVAKDWKFKARSAIRGIMGRGRDSFEGTEGWERLVERMSGLRA